MQKTNISEIVPIFIIGASKSGTTFVYSLLESHPRVIALNRTQAYILTGNSLDCYEILGNYKKLPLWRIHQSLEFKALERELLACREEYSGYSAGGLLILAMLLTVMKSQDRNVKDKKSKLDNEAQVSHFLERTAAHAGRIESILDDFPNAKIIHVMRDPRAMYLSNKNRLMHQRSTGFNVKYQEPKRNQSGISLFTGFAKYYASGIYYARNHPNNYKLLFYEELIEMGPKHVQTLCEFAGLPWHDSLTVPTLSGESWSGNTSVEELRHVGLQPFDKRPLYRWKTKLSRREVEVCERYIRKSGLDEHYECILPTKSSLALRIFWPFESERFDIDRPLRKALAKFCKNYVRSRKDILSHL